MKVEKVVVEVHDTVMETTTIVVRENEQGDTLRLDKLTERDRIRDRALVNDRSEMVRVVRDTVFIEKRDSVSTTTNFTNGTNKPSGFIQALKWIFWILICVIVLVIVFKVTKFINLFKL